MSARRASFGIYPKRFSGGVHPGRGIHDSPCGGINTETGMHEFDSYTEYHVTPTYAIASKQATVAITTTRKEMPRTNSSFLNTTCSYYYYFYHHHQHLQNKHFAISVSSRSTPFNRCETTKPRMSRPPKPRRTRTPPMRDLFSLQKRTLRNVSLATLRE